MTRKNFLPPGTGLKFWLDRVVFLHPKADRKITFNNLHDLRTALRRCRTFAKGLSDFGERATWRQVDRLAKTLFRSLAELRDIHVLTAWTRSLFPRANSIRKRLLSLLAYSERMAEKKARKILRSFDLAQWRQLSRKLSGSLSDFEEKKTFFIKQARRRLEKARYLHAKALQEGSDLSYHQLRIGLKRYRYMIENFLPEYLIRWGRHLKELQDLLGEYHDLFLLEGKVKTISGRSAQKEDRAVCLQILERERKRRLRRYLDLTSGERSYWKIWDRELRS
jgi:CHAD domain-containing protein